MKPSFFNSCWWESWPDPVLSWGNVVLDATLSFSTLGFDWSLFCQHHWDCRALGQCQPWYFNRYWGKKLWTVGNLVVRFWYPSLVLVEFISLPEIIAHRDACKRCEIIVVIAIVFTFFSISHHHHQNHHFFLKFIPPHGTTTAQMSWSCQYLSSQVWRIFSRPDCFENAKSRLSIGVTTFTPLPGCLVAEAYLQPAVVLSGRFFHFVSYFSHFDFRRSLVAQMSLWQPCLLLRWGWHDGNILGPKMVHFAKDRCTSLRIREMMKQHSRIQIAKCDLLRFWRMKYLEMLADRKDLLVL